MCGEGYKAGLVQSIYMAFLFVGEFMHNTQYFLMALVIKFKLTKYSDFLIVVLKYRYSKMDKISFQYCSCVIFHIIPFHTLHEISVGFSIRYKYSVNLISRRIFRIKFFFERFCDFWKVGRCLWKKKSRNYLLTW